jgi:hypothetical protein
MSQTTTQTTSPSEEFRDLGFGTYVATRSTRRLLNRDDSVNTARKGLGFFVSLNLYNALLTISWPAFVVLAGSFYCLANVVFALGYVACGPGALGGPPTFSDADRFLQAFSSVCTPYRPWATATSYP